MASSTMTEGMKRALDSLTATERRVILAVSTVSELTPLVRKLMGGFASQIRADQAAEAAFFDAYEAEHAEETARLAAEHFPPLPDRPGRLVVDPTTGQVIRVDDAE